MVPKTLATAIKKWPTADLAELLLSSKSNSTSEPPTTPKAVASKPKLPSGKVPRKAA
jgi:hypothetical protein